MNVTVMLADAAQIDPSGKLHALGLGWSVTSPVAPAMAIVALIRPEDGDEIENMDCQVRLVDALGDLVHVSLPDGGQGPPVEMRIKLQAHRDPEADVHAEVRGLVPLTVTLGPGLVLSPDSVYTWQVEINKRTEPDWCVQFATRADQPGPQLLT